MAVIGALLLGASGQQASGKLVRLALGAAWRPAAAPLSAVPGVLSGPPGTMMELTLVNPTTLGVNPGVAAVQGTHSGDQGQYEVPNDAYATLAVTGQHASQFRRSLVALSVADSQAAGVASSASTDRAWLQIVDGPLSATAPAPLPATPANTLLLGEVAIPPVGQTVTLTPYNPRTVPRGAIQPVYNDALTYPGHGAEPGAYIGQYRDHPIAGAQRWNGTRWEDLRNSLLAQVYHVASPQNWGDALIGAWQTDARYDRAPGGVRVWDKGNNAMRAPWNGEYRAHVHLHCAGGADLALWVLRLTKNGTAALTNVVNSSAGRVHPNETYPDLVTEVFAAAGDLLRVFVFSTAGTGMTLTAGTPGTSGQVGFFLLQYLGPSPAGSAT